MLTLVSAAVFAQVPVTSFMGVSVDGSEKDMVATFMEKGFEFFPEERTLYGKCNGTDVSIQMEINANTNKIYSLYVCERVLMDEVGIRKRFNQLVGRFQQDGSYKAMADYSIPAEVKIGDELRKGGDRLKAVFYQVGDKKLSTGTVDMDVLQKYAVHFAINGYGGKYYIEMNFYNGYNFP